jgi:glycosyltransferase involved in cell wall biosynthesis
LHASLQHRGRSPAPNREIRRVAVVSHTNTLYGAGRSLLELVDCLLLAELSVAVALPMAGPLEKELRRRGCHLWLENIPKWTRGCEANSNLSVDAPEFSHAAQTISRLAANWGADLIWSNSSVTHVGALVANKLGIPHIWHLRELNSPELSYEFSVGDAAARDLIAAATQRVAVSRSVKEFYEAMGCGACRFIYNGIGPERSLATRRCSSSQDTLTRLLIVGQVMESKGQLTAIEAVSRLRSAGHCVVLRVVGDGDVESCQRYAQKVGTNGWVEFPGFSHDLDEHYAWADIALACAPSEAMGRATAEAMSWGLPIAGHHGAGTGELISEASAGLLYDGSAEQLAERILCLIKEPTEAQRMGEAGQRWTRVNTSSECHASKIREVLLDLQAGQVERHSP